MRSKPSSRFPRLGRSRNQDARPEPQRPVLFDWIGTRLAEIQELPVFWSWVTEDGVAGVKPGPFLEVNVRDFYRWG